jgi:C4-dicarboxylate transporter, DctM subunit
MSSILFILLIVMILSSVPIYIALLFSTLVFTGLFVGMPLEAILQRVFAGVDKFALLAVPMFIFAANVMRIGGLSTRIIALAQAMVGHLPGGLALTTIVACMLFGAVSGSSPATVVAIGAIILPALKEAQYPERFSIGLVTSSASVALIIPPSIGMIIYGVVTGTSVGDLFIAGIIPGILLGLAFMVHAWFFAVRKKLPTGNASSAKQLWKAFRQAGWALGIPVLIIGGIYGGVFTPTEAAAAACVYAISVTSIVYRETGPKRLLEIAVESAHGTAQIMILIGAASAFSWILTMEQVPQVLSTTLLSLSDSAVVILLAMNVILLLAGMFIDPTSTTMIFAPIFLPICLSLGMSPVHLGVIIVVNCAIGMFTPPFGFNLFVASGISKLSIDKLAPSVMPFIGISIVVVLLVTFVPQLSLWLPGFLK